MVRCQYGDNFLHPAVRVYKGKVKNAQEAHEAIRPAGTPFRLPDTVRGELGDQDQYRLFELIWKRTIACQMSDAKKQRVSITIEGGGATFTASGTSIVFEGFLRAYVEGSDNPEAEIANRERILPRVSEQDALAADSLDPKSHTTQPPADSVSDGIVRLQRQVKGRNGKAVTLVSGLPLTGNELKILAKELKNACGVGGSINGPDILIQGDKRDYLKEVLEGKGYCVKLSGG